MQPLSTATVTSVKRQRRDRNKGTTKNTVHVTRIQSLTPISAKKMTESIRTGENIHISPAMSNVPLVDPESRNIERQRQIFTVGAEKKKSCNFASKCSPLHFLLLGLLLAFLLASIAVALYLLLASKTTATVTTTSITSTNSSSVNTSTISSTTTPSFTTTLTTPAATVTITSNICTSTWSGITIIASCTNCPFIPIYSSYSYNYTAIASATRIAFAMVRQTGYFGLDDISVRNFMAPNTEILVNGGFELGNLTSWAYCDQSNSPNTGGVKSTSSNFSYLSFTYFGHSGSYYYVGGSTTTTDYISQTFPTNIGDQYTVTFCFINAGTGPLTSGTFFLGV